MHSKASYKRLGILLIFLVISMAFVYALTEIKPVKVIEKDKNDINKSGNGNILADLWPIVSISASSDNVTTTAVLTATASDTGSNAGLLWLKIYENGTEIASKSCNSQTTCVLVKTVVHNEPGYYEYYAEAKDLGGHVKQSDKIYVNFNGLNQPPVITSYMPENLNPEVDENSSLYFEVQAYDPNGDELSYKFKLDGQEVSNTNSWLYKPGFFESGSHEVLAIVSDGKGGIATVLWNVTVNNVLIPTSCQLYFEPESPISYDEQPFIVYCNCNSGEAQAELWRDGINVSDEIGQPVTLAAKPEGYLYVCNVSETENYQGASNESLYIINKASHQAHLALNGYEHDLSIVYGTQSNATGWLEINQAIQQARLYRNGELVASGSPATEIALLGAGIYNYTYYYPESQNYTSQIVTRWLTVEKAETELLLNAVPGWNVVYGQSINISCQANNNEVLLNLYINGSNVASGYGLIYYYNNGYNLAAGSYDVVCNTTGSQNYTAASVSNDLNIGKAQTILTLNALPSWNVIYGSETNVSCYANHNQAIPTLYRNNQQVSNPDIAILAAGNYMYTCNISESQNYTSASISNLLIVNKKVPSVNLLLNGIDGDIDVNISNLVEMNASLFLNAQHQQPSPRIDYLPNKKIKQGPYTLYLYLDGRVVASGDYQVIYERAFNVSEVGLHNVTAYFPGNENYTASYETHFVNVLPDTQIPQVTIYSPLNQTYNISQIDLNYTATDNLAIDSCWYSVDEGQTNISLSDCQNTTLNLADGFYHLIVYANDTSGNIGYDDVYFTINTTLPDTEPPFITFIPPTPFNGSVMNQDWLYINVSAYDNVAIANALLEWQGVNESLTEIMPGIYAVNKTNLANGWYVFKAYAIDISNNVNSTDERWVYINITYDNEAPNVTIESPLNFTYTTSQIWINITAIDNFEVDSIWYSVNNGPNITYTGPILQNFADGNYLLEAWANDTSGNIGYDWVMFTVNTTIPDIEPPIVTLIAPPNASIDVDGNVTIIYNVTDNMALNLVCDIYSNTSGSWQQDASQNVANASINNYSYYGLADGSYIWNVRCFDGNNYAFAPQNFSFIVNTTLPNQPPYVELIWPDDGYIHNSTSINLSFYAEDDLSNLLDCFLWTNISGSWQQTDFMQINNASINNFSLNNLENGIYLWNVECSDGSLSSFALANRTFVINVTHDVAVDKSYSNSINGIRLIDVETGQAILDDPANLTYGKNYTIRARIINNGPELENIRVIIKIANSTNEFVLANYTTQINQWHYAEAMFNTSSYSLGNYYAIVHVDLLGYIDQNLSNNEANRSFNIVELIDMPPYWTNQTTSPASPTTYGSGPYNFSIEWHDDYGINSVIFEFNGQNYTATCTTLPANDSLCYYTFNDLAAGIYAYRWYANDTAGQWNSTNLLSYVINKADPSAFIHLALNGVEDNLTIVYGTQSNATGWSELPNNQDLVFNLYKNGELVSTGDPATEITLLGAGVYIYEYNTSGGQNYTAASIKRVLNVTKALSQVNLLLNGIDGNITVNISEPVNITCQLLTPNSGYVELYDNGILINSGQAPLENLTSYNSEGLHNITCIYPETQNYTASSETHWINVTQQAILPGEVHLWLNGTEGNLTITYANETLKINASGYGNVSIYLNSSLIAGPQAGYVETFKNLAAGYYNFTAYSTGDASHLPASVTYFLNIEKANSSITLLLNGINADITILQGETVNHTAILNVPTQGIVRILLNGTQQASGNSPLEWLYSYSDPGYYNVTVIFDGNQNYTASQASHFVTVVPVVHDVSVDSITYNKSSSTVYNKDIILIKANVTNLGNIAENNVNITLSDNTNVIAWQLINLSIGETKEVNFTWQASAPANSNEQHILEVYAKPVQGEINLTNNAKSQNIEVWHACAVIDCSVFMPLTQYDSYPLDQDFLVRARLQNAWNNKAFYDFPARLEVSNGLIILSTWPQQQYIDLLAGSLQWANWNVTSKAIGNQTLTTIAGNNDYLASKNITITP